MVSIFDHSQTIWLPSPVDAFRVMHGELGSNEVLDATMDRTKGDLRFWFEGGVDIWAVTFPDGTVELFNYVLSETEAGEFFVNS